MAHGCLPLLQIPSLHPPICYVQYCVLSPDTAVSSTVSSTYRLKSIGRPPLGSSPVKPGRPRCSDNIYCIQKTSVHGHHTCTSALFLLMLVRFHAFVSIKFSCIPAVTPPRPFFYQSCSNCTQHKARAQQAIRVGEKGHKESPGKYATTTNKDWHLGCFHNVTEV